jgi:hypothetical protein
MATTYEPIATTTVTNSSSVTLSSIPSTYTDLRLVIVASGGTGSGSYFYLRLNGDSNTLYSDTVLVGTGAAAVSYTETSTNKIGFSYTSIPSATDMRALCEIDIFSYAGATYKTLLGGVSNNQNTADIASNVTRVVGVYRSTTAVTSLTILPAYDNFPNITVSLYGIKAA